MSEDPIVFTKSAISVKYVIPVKSALPTKPMISTAFTKPEKVNGLEENYYNALKQFKLHSTESSSDLLTAISDLYKSKLFNDKMKEDFQTALVRELEGDRLFQPQSNKRLRPSGGNVIDNIYEIFLLLGWRNISPTCRNRLTKFGRDKNWIWLYPCKPQSEKHQYTFGKFLKSDGDPCRVFERQNHNTHSMKDAMRILLETKGKVTFKGKLNHPYHGVGLWWVSPLLKEDYPSSSHTSTNSRYGCVRFSFPVSVIHGLSKGYYCLGTRQFPREICHSILVNTTSREIKGCGIDFPSINLFKGDHDLIKRGDEGAWRWFRPNTTYQNWYALDFAVTIEEGDSIQLGPEDGVRIDFVDHTDYCIPTKKRLNERSACYCTREDAMRYFIKELHERDKCLREFRGFFEDSIYKELEELEEIK